jgi:ABC-type transport system involved in cytochrome c biogenesis permease subunit
MIATRWLRWLLLLWCVLVGACSRPAPSLSSAPQRTEPWPQDLVSQIAAMPVQDSGRIKPLSTLAAYALYFVHGRRDLQYSLPGDATAKVTLEPTEWLLDVWCFPEQAADYGLFRIENSGVLDALGIANEGQSLRFDFLSYRQLLPHGEKLGELASQYRKIEARDRSLVQEHLVQLDQQLSAYHRLHEQFRELHSPVQLEGDQVRAVFGGRSQVPVGELLQRFSGLVELMRSVGRDENDPRLGNTRKLLEVLVAVARQDRGPRWFPPLESATETDEWYSLGEVVFGALQQREIGDHLKIYGHLQAALAGPDMATRSRELGAMAQTVAAVANRRGEASKAVLETDYFRASWHYQSIHWFLLAFLLAAVGWAMPRNKALWWAALVVTGIAEAMLVYDLVLRCIITERPPIKNLYDTFLFIAAVGVLVAMVAEMVLPRRIALATAPVLGALTVMFARMFEVTKGEDTMAPLVAVLDSNFWLATHVTTINIGYAAGLVAALFGNAWILCRALRITHPDEPMAKSIVRMTYGATAFSLAFGVVGTILGGVWANDSWGRFWGWDPKENGALMICLSQIALLHARMSGMVRDFGFAVWSSVTGMVVLFSWFHVNLLGVGLHNYGFSSGLRDAVWTGYSVEAAIIAVGMFDVLLRPKPVRLPAAHPTAAEAASHWPAPAREG